MCRLNDTLFEMQSSTLQAVCKLRYEIGQNRADQTAISTATPASKLASSFDVVTISEYASLYSALAGNIPAGSTLGSTKLFAWPAAAGIADNSVAGNLAIAIKLPIYINRHCGLNRF